MKEVILYLLYIVVVLLGAKLCQIWLKQWKLNRLYKNLGRLIEYDFYSVKKRTVNNSKLIWFVQVNQINNTYYYKILYEVCTRYISNYSQSNKQRTSLRHQVKELLSFVSKNNVSISKQGREKINNILMKTL